MNRTLVGHQMREGRGGKEGGETDSDDQLDSEEDDTEEKRIGSFTLLCCMSSNFWTCTKIILPSPCLKCVSVCMCVCNRSRLIINL